jgi:hypothetical protein
VAGCATGQGAGGALGDAPADAPDWFTRRGRDLLAIFDLDLSFGPGIGVRAAVTREAQLGFMLLGPTESSQLIPTSAVLVGKRGDQFGAWRIDDREYGITPWYPSDANVQRLDRAEPAFKGDLARTRGTQFSVQVHLALIGVEFGFDPSALGRFLSGLVGGEEEPPPNP